AAFCFSVDGRYGYAGTNNTIAVIDLLSPGSPRVATSIATGATRIKAADRKLYALKGIQLKMYDTTLPLAAIPLSTTGNYSAQGLDADGTTLLLATPDTGISPNRGGLYVLDTLLPIPLTLANVFQGFDNWTVAANDQVALVTANASGLRLIDMQDLAHPRVASAMSGTFRASAMNTTHAFVSQIIPGNPGTTDIVAVDIRNRFAPLAVGRINLGNLAVGELVISGNYLYAAAGIGGLKVINVTNPAAPLVTAAVAMTGSAASLAVEGNHAFVGASNVEIVDISSPSSPRKVGQIAALATAIAVSGNRLYLLEGTLLEAHDISKRDAPQFLGQMASFGAQDLATNGSVVLMAKPGVDHSDATGGIHVVDPSNPAQLRIVDHVILPGTTHAVVLRDNIAIAGDTASNIDIIALDTAAVPPLPTSTSGAAATSTATRTRTNTPTATATHTEAVATSTFTRTYTPTRTATAAPSSTATHTFTHTPTRTPTVPPTSTATLAPTNTRTHTPTLTRTFSHTPTRTPSNTRTFTRTPTRTNSPVPSATRTSTRTWTPTKTFLPTATRTFTRSSTPTRTATFTPSQTATRTSSITQTATRTHTPTISPTFTSTPTSAWTSTHTATRTPTNTPPNTATSTPSFTRTNTPLATATATWSPTPSATPPAAIAGMIIHAGNKQPVADTDVLVHGEMTLHAQTGGDGGFAFALPEGAWTVRPVRHGGPAGVSAQDASTVLDLAAGSFEPTEIEALIADVSGNGTVSGLDAGLILNRVVGNVNSFPVAGLCGSDWIFVPDPNGGADQYPTQPGIIGGVCQPGQISYASLEGHVRGQNFLAAAFGDVDQSWSGASSLRANTHHLRIGRVRRSGQRL
ncbi:MAG TPA: hypothetical protein VEB21_07315, partial [Terriglobales bacterium]|nr:hypothetical protein [Terriglobales bacterium]